MKAAVLKTVVRQRTVGSNPTSSATIKYAPVPQLDRGADYESDRRGFESLRAHHLNPQTVKQLKQTQLDFKFQKPSINTAISAAKNRFSYRHYQANFTSAL